jgi:hypothetical protein
VDRSREERDVLLAGLFELRVTGSDFDDEPSSEQIPLARIPTEAIAALVDKLGGDPDTAFLRADGRRPGQSQYATLA